MLCVYTQSLSQLEKAKLSFLSQNFSVSVLLGCELSGYSNVYLHMCVLLWYKHCPEYSKALMGGLQDTVCCSVTPSSRPMKIHIKIYINFLITIQSYYTVMLLTASTRSNKH